jgi:type IV secretory pathway component VirB8
MQIRQEGKEIQEGLRSMLDEERQKHQATMKALANQAEQSSKRANLAMWAALGFSVLSVIAAAIIVAT